MSSLGNRCKLESVGDPPSVVRAPRTLQGQPIAQPRADVLLVRSHLALCLVLLAGTFQARAQATAELKIAREVFANESVPLSISVFGARQVREPEMPAIAGCEIRGGGREQETSINNGRVTSWIRYNYELIASKPGEIEIPAIEVVADGKRIKTPTKKITVLPSESNDLCQALVSVDTRRLYVGQLAKFTMTVFVRQASYEWRGRDGNPRREIVDRQTTEQRFFDWERSNLGGFRSTSRGSTVKRADNSGQLQVYYSYELAMDAVIEQAGLLPFGDLSIVIAYPRFENDSFGNGGRVADWRRVRIKPDINVPEVQPLPTAGRPASFTGAVGVFRIDASAKPLRVRVGDPIELTMSIAGRGSLESLPPPTLALQPKLADGFRVPDENLAGKMENGRRVFTQTIRAKRSGITEIPPIEYAYFDADRGEYALAASAPIPIRIEASNQLDAGTLTELTVPDAAAKPAAVEAVDGLLGNSVDESHLLKKRGEVGVRELALATFVPPAVFMAGCAWSAVSRRRGDHGIERRRKAALPTALQKIEAAASRPPRERSSALVAALGGYLADRTNEPAGRFAGGAIARWLQQQGVSEPVVAECRSFVERCESAAYGGAEGDGELATAARDCIQRLEREVF